MMSSQDYDRFMTNKTLMNGEQMIWKGRPSWMSIAPFYVKWGVLAILPSVISILLATKTDFDAYWGTTSMFTLIALSVVFLIGAVRRLSAQYIITTDRITVRRGILNRKVQRTQISYIRSADYRQSLFERKILDVGDIEIATASSDPNDAVYVMHGVRSPQDLVQAIDECKFRNRERYGRNYSQDHE